MIHDEMRELQKYLGEPPIPFFKRNTPLKEDEETLKKKEEELKDEIIKTLEKNNIKDEFTFLAFIIALGMWDISSVKTEDGYVRKEDMGRIS